MAEEESPSLLPPPPLRPPSPHSSLSSPRGLASLPPSLKKWAEELEREEEEEEEEEEDDKKLDGRLSEWEIMFKNRSQSEVLATLHQEITALAPDRLHRVTLVDCELESIPPELGTLSELGVLELTGNKITVLSAVVQNLKKLSHLYLGHNRVERVEINILVMPKLNFVVLTENQLRHFPLSFLTWKSEDFRVLLEGNFIDTGMVGQYETKLAEESSPYFYNQHVPSSVWPGLLYISGNNPTAYRKELDKLKIVRILSLGERASRVCSGLEIKWLDVQDTARQDIKSHFQECYDWIDGAISKNKAVLVHCKEGVSRSATVVCSYLMRKLCWSFERSLKVLRTRRYCIDPNPGFVAQLSEYEREVFADWCVRVGTPPGSIGEEGREGKEDEREEK